MFLTVYMRENYTFKYSLSKHSSEHEVGEYTSLGWQVIAKYVLFRGVFVTEKEYYSQCREEHRQYVNKKNKKGELIHILKFFHGSL